MKVVACPGLRVMGRDNVPMVKPLPATLICVAVKVAVPLFINWNVCVASDPTVTLPKFALEGVMVRVC